MKNVKRREVLLTETSASGVWEGGVRGLADAGLVHGLDAELVLLALGETLDGAGAHVALDLAAFHEVLCQEGEISGGFGSR